MDQYFLRKSVYQSPDPEWAKRYLESSKDRITALLKDDLENDFWERYSQIYGQYCATGKLLFRAKTITGTTMTLVQIWQSKEAQRAFDREVYTGINFINVLNNNGLKITSEESYVSAEEAVKQIEAARKLPHLLQFVSDAWKTQDMMVGDPLKAGRGYLPYPENT